MLPLAISKATIVIRSCEIDISEFDRWQREAFPIALQRIPPTHYPILFKRPVGQRLMYLYDVILL